MTLRAVLVLGLLMGGAPNVAHAQSDVEWIGRMLGGTRPPASFYQRLRERPQAFQFSPDNGWMRRGRAIADARGAARTRLMGLGGAAIVAGGPPQLVLQGDLRMPVLLALYANTDSASLVSFASRATMESRMLGTAGAPPYSVTTYYREISRNRLNVTGTVMEWVRVSQNDTYYEGGTGCNGLCSTSRVDSLIAELVRLDDPGVDFGQFDNDGPDNVPNSGDDDGYVDAIVVFHPEVDGACGNLNAGAVNNLWAHQSSVNVITGDPSARAGFGNVRIRDYIIQGAQGGDGGCSNGQPQAIGVVSHETGHLFGLPDLYDGTQSGEGIGHWGLMGSGNWNTASRPAHMEAWSRAELGWVTEVLVPRDSALTLRAVETADTALVLPIAGAGEYYLLENRQPVGSDSMIHGPGLLVWHVDSVLIGQRRFANLVNTLRPYGLALVQADGQDHLLKGTNRGDAGDPYPGATLNVRLGASSVPAALTNAGVVAAVAIDSIRQISPFGDVAFRVRFGLPLLVTTTGSGAYAASPALAPDSLLPFGTQVTLVATPAPGAVFDSWSGDTTTTNDTLRLVMTRPWAVRATFAPPLVATTPAPAQAVMGADFAQSLKAAGGLGSYGWSLVSGALPQGLSLSAIGVVSGVPAETGAFQATARVQSGAQQRNVVVAIDVTAPALTTASVLGPLLGTGGTLTADEARYLDLLGNRNGTYDVGDFHAFIVKTGGAVSAEAMAKLLRAEGKR